MLTLLEDLYVDSAAKVGRMFTKKSCNGDIFIVRNNFIVNKDIIDRGRFISSASK